MSGDVRCIDCRRLGIRQAPEKMAALGFGLCGEAPPVGHFKAVLFRRSCGLFDRADQDLIRSRLEWVNNTMGRGAAGNGGQ